VLVRIGEFEVTSFGVLVAVAATVGLWLFQRELRRSGLPDSAVDTGMAGVMGGLAGAKLVWAIEHAGNDAFVGLLFARGGLSWFGGLAGGLVAGFVLMRRRQLPILAVLAAATPALALGHAIGRIGCFLVGDDYGLPSALPWALAFPEGLPPTDVPVHPTQLYEAVPLVVLALRLLRWRRAGVADRLVLARYLLLAGALRFGIEFLRVHEPFVGGLAVAHVAALIAIALGTGLMLFRPTHLSPT
jgi:phosphatidylglycerol---prolipoprotein diacylglyceryl transferase